MAKVLKLNDAAKNVLKAACCIGSPFLLSTLILITEDSISVETVVSEGFISSIDVRNTWHRFSHDHIQEALQSLISDDERDTLHYRIGKLLFKKCLAEENDENIFVTVNLLNSAMKSIKDQEGLNEITRLNFRAGQKALSLTAFKSALHYFQTGVKLLQDDCWEKDYDFSLKLHNAVAEAALGAKDRGCMQIITQKVLQKATNFLHKTDCYAIQMKELNEHCNHKKASDIGLYVLKQLGDSFSIHHSETLLYEEIQKALIMFGNFTADEIAVKQMQNKAQVCRMQFLSDVALDCIYSCPDAMPTVASRMIQHTLIHGVSKFSAYGFALMAMVVCAKLESFEEGHQMGLLSLSLLKKFPAKEWIPQIYGIYYGSVHHWSDSIHKCLEPLMYSHRVALEVGANDLSLISANTYCIYSFLTGKPLANLKEEMEAFDERLPVKTSALSSVYQAVNNFLTESGDNAAFLTGLAFDYRYCKEKSVNVADYGRSLVPCVMMAYYFYEYDMAFKFAEECRPLSKLFLGEYSSTCYIFYDGLVALALAKTAKDASKWKKIAHESISKLKKWSKTSENYKNKLSLLEAEMASLNNDNSKALTLYKNATALSKSNQFIHEEAIAYERAAIFFLEKQLIDKASCLLSHACRVYMQWGAKSKVNHLKQLYTHLIAEKYLFEMPSASLNCSNYTETSSAPIVSALTSVGETSLLPNNKKARMSHH